MYWIQFANILLRIFVPMFMRNIEMDLVFFIPIVFAFVLNQNNTHRVSWEVFLSLLFLKNILYKIDIIFSLNA